MHRTRRPEGHAPETPAAGSPADAEPPITPIPRPSFLPDVNRRQFLKLGAGGAAALAVGLAGLPAAPAAAAASAGPAPGTATQAAPSAAPFKLTDGPIRQKWLKLGGRAVVGDPTSNLTATPDNLGSYQTFTKGVIIFSNDWGAQLVTIAIFDRWLSLFGQKTPDGQDFGTFVGFPRQDFVSDNGVDTGFFERGMIVVSGGVATLVSGFIYEHYFWVKPPLGLPTGEQAAAPGGGLFQSFQGGDIYWRTDIGAAAVRGAIRDRWLALGGAAGPLGFPLTDEQPVLQDQTTTQIGSVGFFEHGPIYFSPATGAWEVTGEVRTAYEVNFGGPGAPNGFGFPTGPAGTTAAGNLFSDFERGVIVNLPSGPHAGTYGFGQLELFINRFEAPDEDCVLGICTTPSLFVNVKLSTSDGLNRSFRLPDDGTFDGSGDPRQTFALTPRPAHHDLVIDIDMDGFDVEDVEDDEHLGHVHRTYTVDDLFGLLDGGEHFNKIDGEGVTFDFSVRNPLPFDPTKFRQNLFWSFRNFNTAELTYDQFAATFSDVDPNESAWVHPFNALYFRLAYKHLADNGNCFGMALESIFAQNGHSIYAEPIIRFWPDTQFGQQLGPNHQDTINEINIKHGYQLGAGLIDWFLFRLALGQTHDPKQVFRDSRDAFKQGDYPIISLSDGYFGGSGHAVRPYKWDQSDPNKWVMFVANPNNPASTALDDDDPCVITIDPNDNSFTFKFSGGDTWTGGDWSGGRMFYTPFHRLAETPRTPFWEVLALIVGGILLIAADGGQTQQITDAAGRTLFEPDLGAAPTRWDEYRRDDATRVPNLTHIAYADGVGPFGGVGPAPLEMYYGRGPGASYTHELMPAPGATPGAPYQWVLHTPTLSAQLSIPGTPGVADKLTAAALHTSNKAVTVNIHQDGGDKSIAWTMSGPVKQRWFELTNLKLAGGQSLTTRIANSGFAFSFENDGPATTADLRVKAGPTSDPVVVGQISIGSGSSGPFTFEAPKTTLTTDPPAPNGKAGWFVSPVTITLSAFDFSGTGIDHIEYGHDGDTFVLYTGPFVYGGPNDLTDEGTTTLFYRAVDNDGDQENTEHNDFMVDTRAPEITTNLADSYTRIPPITLHFSAGDPTPGSGLDAGTLAARFNGGTFVNQPVSDGETIDFFWQPLGSYTLSVTAGDVAGNVGNLVKTTTLVATLDSLATTIRKLRELGEIDNDGIENSLLGKVGAASSAFQRGQSDTAVNQLGALLNDLSAQRGKHITERADDLLAADVAFVQTHLG